MKTKKNIVIFVMGFIMLISFVMIKKNENKIKSADASEKNLGIATEIITAQKGKLAKEIKYIGTIDSGNSTIVSPIVSSDVISLNVKEGDSVEKGDLIAKLDDSSLITKLETTLKKAETTKENYDYLNNEVVQYYETNPTIKKIEKMEHDYEYLNDEFEKYRVLYKEGAISKDAYDKFVHDRYSLKIQLGELKVSSVNQLDQLKHERDMSQMQIKELESEVNGVKKEIEEMEIISPRSGIVRKLYYEVGDLAVSGNPLTIIDEKNDFIVAVDVTESDLKKLSKETKVVLCIADDLNLEAPISKLPTSINPSTRIGEVEIEVPQNEQGLNIIIGSSIEVGFVIKEIEGDIILPKTSIKRLGDKYVVYVVEDSKVRQQIIETGIEFGDKVQVISGIEVNDKIAFKNLNKLYDGAKVFVFKGDN